LEGLGLLFGLSLFLEKRLTQSSNARPNYTITPQYSKLSIMYIKKTFISCFEFVEIILEGVFPLLLNIIKIVSC